MTSSCAKRCAATLSSTTSSAYIQRYAIFLRLPLSGSVACNHVSTRAGQDPPPVRAFYLAISGGGGPANLALLGPIVRMHAIDRSRSVEQLEGDVWPCSDFQSHVVQE